MKGGKINNCAGAVIDVKGKGKLVDGIYNAGVINVIENAIVIVDDIYENAAGIIDVTKANAGTESQAAKCINNETGMFFRYYVQSETTAKDLAAALKTRISAQNWTINPIILIWNGNSPATFAGTDLAGKNVHTVTIDRDLTWTSAVKFDQAVDITINSGKTLTAGNGVDTTGFNVGSAVVTINGMSES